MILSYQVWHWLLHSHTILIQNFSGTSLLLSSCSCILPKSVLLKILQNSLWLTSGSAFFCIRPTAEISLDSSVTEWTHFISVQTEVCKECVSSVQGVLCMFLVWEDRAHICSLSLLTHHYSFYSNILNEARYFTLVGDTEGILYNLARKNRVWKLSHIPLSISHREHGYFSALPYPSKLNKELNSLHLNAM